MINLSKHIEYQLLYHDIVMVPQLGTFKATYVPSKWVEDEEILLPPYRALTFTQEVNEKDTQFIETISASYQISTEEAYMVTMEFTENIQQELAEYGSYDLGSIGEFVQEEATGKIQFIPCQAGVASPWLYGLDAIHVLPAKQKEPLLQKHNDKRISFNADTKNVNIRINRRFFDYVAAIAASIVLFFGFSTSTGDNAINGPQTSASELFLPSNVIALQGKSAKNIEPKVTEENNTADELNNTETTKDEIEEVPTFSVVLCCGVPVQNAESYCKNLNERGIKAVVDNSGKFLRVLIPGFTSREEALTEVRSLRSISKEFSNAWVMEKK